jgi:hypothetical protein
MFVDPVTVSDFDTLTSDAFVTLLDAYLFLLLVKP